MDLQLVIPKETRMVEMQFMVSRDLVPPDAVWKGHETSDDRVQRKCTGTGRMVVQPTENVGIGDLDEALGLLGFVLTRVVCIPRIADKGGTIYTVSFTFARGDHAVTPEFEGVRDRLLLAFHFLLTQARWRVLAYHNPFYSNGQVVEGVHVSINMKARNPLVFPDGSLVMARRKDADGRKYGDPVPVEPEHHLRVVEYVLA